jgi:hypothetical protein
MAYDAVSLGKPSVKRFSDVDRDRFGFDDRPLGLFQRGRNQNANVRHCVDYICLIASRFTCSRRMHRLIAVNILT